MLEDQVTVLLQKYLGNYVRGLSKEALKISVWKAHEGNKYIKFQLSSQEMCKMCWLWLMQDNLVPRIWQSRFQGAIYRASDNLVPRIWQSRFQGAIYRASGPATVSILSEIPSPSGSTKSRSFRSDTFPDLVNIEKLFVTGVLDELRVCFTSSFQSNQSFKMTLLAKESRLFEFLAVGGQVELSVRANNIFIGTLLRSLEIEDQFCCSRMVMPRYLARSFIKNTEADTVRKSLSVNETDPQNISNNQLHKIDS